MTAEKTERAERRKRQPKKGVDPSYLGLARALGLQISAVWRDRGPALNLPRQEDLARAAGIDTARLSNIVNGKTLIATDTLVNIAKALRVLPGQALLDPVFSHAAEPSYHAPEIIHATPADRRRDSADQAATAAGVDLQTAVSDAIFAVITDWFEAIATARHAQQAPVVDRKTTGARGAATGRRARG